MSWKVPRMLLQDRKLLNALRRTYSTLESEQIKRTPPREVIADSLRHKSTATEFAKESGADVLPALPVPKLEETLTKLLRSVQPFGSNEEFQRTEKLAKEFASGAGQKLQALLEQRAQQKINWLSEWWLDVAYLEFRSPVIVHSSPGLVFPLENFKTLEDQLRYAAKFIFGATAYKKSIDNMTIPADMMGKRPLDMSQYTKVFGTNRRPSPEKDVMLYNPRSKHIVITYKNYFFKVDVVDENGDVLKPAELYKQLKNIVSETSGLSGAPVGILSTDNRDTWAVAYQELVKDPQNAQSVKVIEESLFLMCIDRPNRPLRSPKGGIDERGVEDLEKSEKQTIAALQMLHGNMTNSGNRWYDKTIQFVVGTEGECGLTYEHSPSEGPPIANLVDFVLKTFPDIERILASDNIEGIPLYMPKKLPFNISDTLSKAITSSKDTLTTLIQDLDMACFTFQKYGKEFIKSVQFSPDSYIQMAIQAAFFRIHRVPGAHYESAATRMYLHGRTETIRSCSVASVEFAESLLNASLSPQEKYIAMKKAIEAHKKYAAEAVQGFGIDRHILGLKLIAKKNNIELPQLFSDPLVQRSSYFRLSTSQVASQYEAFMCYGPLVPDGYGCCYNPRKNDISFGISAMNSSKETNAEEFKKALQQCLLDMHDLALKNVQSKL